MIDSITLKSTKFTVICENKFILSFTEDLILYGKAEIKMNVNGNKFMGKILLSHDRIRNTLTIKISSLSKMVYNDPFINVEKYSFAETSDKLAHYLAPYVTVDFDDLRVTQIDIGVNLNLDFPLHYFIDYLIKMTPSQIGNKEKVTYNNGVYFKDKETEKILFYDKFEKEKKNKVLNNSLISGELNLLRFEVQIRGAKAISSKGRYGMELLFRDVFSEQFVKRSKEILKLHFEKFVLNINQTRPEIKMVEINNVHLTFANYLLIKVIMEHKIDLDYLYRNIGNRFSGKYKAQQFRKIKKLMLLNGNVEVISDVYKKLLKELKIDSKNT